MPDSYAETADGLLLLANGVDEMLVWDGLGDMQPAGLQAPTQALAFSGSGSGSLTGDYYAYTRFVDARGNYSNLSPLAGPVTLAGAGAIDYTGVPTPTQAKVVRRQVLRNNAGQATVFYVDIDTTDITSTTFSSTLDDQTLATQEAQSLFDSNGALLANSHAPPPSHKSVIAQHLDRMFAAVDVEYREGCASTTLGAQSVQGVGTQWPATFQGRFLWVDGASQSYEIQNVDPASQVLTLVESYADVSNPYARYCIRPAPAERRLVYYSGPGQPESWPATQALAIQDDGDELTGLMPKGSFLYLLERRHVYRFTFQSDPGSDGFVFLSGGRGCVNNRCWVIVDDNAYMLDTAGIYAFTGGQEAQPLSAAIQDLFEPEQQDSQYKIQWAASAYFHASYHPGQNVIRWFVALSGQDYPRHALCLELSATRWWIEEYPVPITASVQGRFLGERRVFLGGPGGQVYLVGEGQLDRVRPGATPLRGNVSSSGTITLSDSLATFPAALVGSPVVIVSGRGRGQRRIVAKVTTTTLTLCQPWLVQPDASSVYQLGGVQWRYLSKFFRYRDDDQETPRRLELIFEPCQSDTLVEARFFQDRSGQPVIFGSTGELNGFTSAAGDEVLSGDLTRATGYLQRRLDGFKDLYAEGPRFLQAQLSGVTNQDQVRIYEMTLDGVQ